MTAWGTCGTVSINHQNSRYTSAVMPNIRDSNYTSRPQMMNPIATEYPEFDWSTHEQPDEDSAPNFDNYDDNGVND